MKKFVLLFVACLLLTGTGLSAYAADGDLPVIKLNYFREIDDLPFYVGIEKGYFKEEGVKIELIRIGGSINIMAAAMRGDIQGGDMPLPALFHASLRKIPLKVVAWLGTTHPGTKCGIHVCKNGDIHSIKDLKGKCIATSGSIVCKTILSEALDQVGLSTKDVNPMLGIDMQEPMQYEAILNNPHVDAMITWDPVATMLEVHGVSRLLASFDDVIPHFVFGGVFFSNTFLETHPEQVRAFLRGLVKSFVFIREHEAEAREFLTAYTGVTSDITKVCALRKYSPTGWEPAGLIDHQRDLMVKFGSLSKSVSLEPVTDYSYLPE